MTFLYLNVCIIYNAYEFNSGVGGGKEGIS